MEALRQRALERFTRATHHKSYYEIELGNGGTYLIDDQDVEAVKYWTWTLSDTGYARRRRPKKREPGIAAFIRLHHVVMERKLGRLLKPSEWVDHRNGNPLDNRRSNLRICNVLQNAHNTRKMKGHLSSIYKGVSWSKSKNKWQVEIRFAQRKYHIGRFHSEVEAAYVYDQWALQLRGRFARLNVL